MPLKKIKGEILKAWVVLLGSKSRCFGATFEFLSDQLLCSSDRARRLGEGLLLLKTHMLLSGELPFLTDGGFPILQEGSFFYSGACLGVWLHLKKTAGTHEAGRLRLGIMKYKEARWL